MKKRRKRKTKIVWVAIILVILLVIIGTVFGVNRTKKNNAKVLNEPLSEDLNTIDLSKIIDLSSLQVAGNTQQGLLSRTKNSNPKPGLAKSWSHTPNGLTWTFRLRKNLKWSNGDPLTAHDFVYAWRRTVNPKTASQYAYIYSGIKNADEINSGKDKNLNSLGVSAPNKNTFVVNLTHPMPQFENLMSFPFFFAQDKKVVQKLGTSIGTSSKNQVYSGPYKFQGWNGNNNKFKLVKNKYYWNKKAVKNDGVNFQVITDPTALVSSFKKGNLDRADLTSPEQIKKYHKNKNYHQLKIAQTDYLQYNQNGSVPALKNRKIRQALNLTTNRKGMAKDVSNGLNLPASGITTTGLTKIPSGNDFAKTVSRQTNYRYDIKKAKKLFAQGLKEARQKKLTLTIEADQSVPGTKPTLDTIQQSWNKLPGLSVKEDFVPSKKRHQDVLNHHFQVIFANWVADYNEPLTFINMFTTGSSYNSGSWSNKAYDNLVQRASAGSDALDDVKRSRDELQAEKILYQQAAINPIYWQGTGQLRNSHVKGFRYFPSGVSYYYWMTKVNR